MTDAEALLRRWMAGGDHRLLAADVDWRVSPGYPVPRTEWHGRAEVEEVFFPTLRRHFPGWTIAVESFASLDDGRLLAQGAYEARDRAGRTGRVPFLHLWTVRDGAVAAVRAVADFGAFAPLEPPAPEPPA